MLSLLLIAAKRHLGSRRVHGALRVIAYGTVVCAGLAAYSYRSAKADIGKSSMQIGRDLAGALDGSAETTEVRLNGESVFVASAVTSDSVTDVLDRFEKHCNANPGALGQAWTQLSKVDTKGDLAKETKLPISSLGVVRHEGRREGIVLCLIKGSETPRTFSEATRAFSYTHDLGTLGKLRYVYAKGSPQSTLVLTVWTEDRFQLDVIFPRHGEAPGKDPEGMPRPPESRRLMSIDVPNTPFGTHVYRSTSTPDQIVTFYDKVMDDKGWTIIDPPDSHGLGHAYMKGGVQYVVGTGRDETGGTVVSIGELAARPRKK